MPRKRATRLQPTTKHVKVDMQVAEGLKENDRKEQLAVFLRDYDYRVKNVLKDIDKKKRAMLTFIQMRFEKLISDLPCEIKDMTLEDFAKNGGTFEAALAHVRQGSMQDMKQKKLAEIQNMKWDVKECLEDISEEGSDDPVSAPAKPTTVRAKRLMGKAASRTSNRNRLMTPTGSASHPLWGATPLITPKFDPNLPMTPENIREAKPGETLLSLAGSPILAKKNRRLSEGIDKHEMAQQWSDIAGTDLTPTRVAQMITALSQKINQN